MLSICKTSLKKYMLEADQNGRMLFLRNEFLLCIFKCKWNRVTRHLLAKISTVVNSITRSTCCNARLNTMAKRQKHRMINILICRAICHRFESSRMQKRQPLEAETLNFKVLMDCSNQQNSKELKKAISLSVRKRNILVIIDKIVSLTRNFSKALKCYPGPVLFIVFVIIFINSIYISLAFHLEVFQSELFRISVI